MKYFSILTLLLMTTLTVSACGAPAAPTANPVDIQSTIAAAALTVYAQTQAAIPTATPVPPTPTFTDTSLPTNTFPPPPASEVTLTPAPNSNAGSGDPCVDKPLPSTLQGETVQIRISNSTRDALRLSVYLNSSGSQSQCGYRTYNLASQESIALNDLVEGCYTLWAWNPDPEGYFIVTNGTDCIDNSDRWVFDISTRSITLRN